MTRGRRDGLAVIWDGTRRFNGGLLNCAAETPRSRPLMADDPRELPGAPAVRHRGRPARAGEPAMYRVELRMTLEELRAIKALARSNGASVADVIRLAVGDLAADAGRPEAVVFGRAVLDSVR